MNAPRTPADDLSGVPRDLLDLPDHVRDDPALDEDDLRVATHVLRALAHVGREDYAVAPTARFPAHGASRGTEDRSVTVPAGPEPAPAPAPARARRRVLAAAASAVVLAAAGTTLGLFPGGSAPGVPPTSPPAASRAGEDPAQRSLEDAARRACTAGLSARSERGPTLLPADLSHVRAHGDRAVALYLDTDGWVVCGLQRGGSAQGGGNWRATVVDAQPLLRLHPLTRVEGDIPTGLRWAAFSQDVTFPDGQVYLVQVDRTPRDLPEGQGLAQVGPEGQVNPATVQDGTIVFSYPLGRSGLWRVARVVDGKVQHPTVPASACTYANHTDPECLGRLPEPTGPLPFKGHLVEREHPYSWILYEVDPRARPTGVTGPAAPPTPAPGAVRGS